MPYATLQTVSGWIELHGENETLRARLLAAAVDLQRMGALEEEVERLRALLGSTGQVEGAVRFAEVVGLSPDPLRELLVIDKGTSAQVEVGDAVLDADGLVGQVVSVDPASARVLMITDLTHEAPVQVLRNDLRAILRGTGDASRLQLQHVPNTADVRVGDLLVTSGLGGRFPPGYPVAVVDEMLQDPSAPFARISARPTAQLSRSRHLVLVSARAEVPDVLQPAPATAEDAVFSEPETPGTAAPAFDATPAPAAETAPLLDAGSGTDSAPGADAVRTAAPDEALPAAERLQDAPDAPERRVTVRLRDAGGAR